MLPIISYIINIIVILIIIYIFYVVYKKQKASEKEEEEGISEEYLENCIDVEYWSYTSMHKPDTLSTCTAYYQANDDIYIDNLSKLG